MKLKFSIREYFQILSYGIMVFAGIIFALAARASIEVDLMVLKKIGGCFVIGFTLYLLSTYVKTPTGIYNNGLWFKSIQTRKLNAWILACLLTSFYIVLYWWPEYLGYSEIKNTGIVACFDPLSYYLKNKAASQWFVYGTLYTLAVVLFGVRFLIKYRHLGYQRTRTLSLMFFQTSFAFLIPEFMMSMNLPYHDYKNLWPLNYSFFDGWHIDQMLANGTLGYWMLMIGLILSFIVSPLFTFLYGKRWYCSWICGCGGLAETAGDSFRHLSSKSKLSWNLERLILYPTLAFCLIMTAGVLYTYLYGKTELLGISTASIRSSYGFLVGAAFSGVIGVGFYPLLGNRVWCRFGCPMAALLGIQQKLFSRFRVTTNGGMCISCGNCATHCEMGIDVRAYAQKGESIVRASCVGCGICSAVCPRGVLKLENGSIDLFDRKTRITKRYQ